MRCMGILTVLYCVYGIAYYVRELAYEKGRWLGSPDSFDWVIFAALSVITLGATIYLAYLGMRLIRVDAAALGPMCLVFGAEIAYFLVTTFIFWNIMPPTNPGLTGGFFGIPEDPFVPQLVTGYTIICLIVCLVLRRGRSGGKVVA